MTDTQVMAALEPCPFCGSDNVLATPPSVPARQGEGKLERAIGLEYADREAAAKMLTTPPAQDQTNEVTHG